MGAGSSCSVSYCVPFVSYEKAKSQNWLRPFPFEYVFLVSRDRWLGRTCLLWLYCFYRFKSVLSILSYMFPVNCLAYCLSVLAHVLDNYLDAGLTHIIFVRFNRLVWALTSGHRHVHCIDRAIWTLYSRCRVYNHHSRRLNHHRHAWVAAVNHCVAVATERSRPSSTVYYQSINQSIIYYAEAA